MGVHIGDLKAAHFNPASLTWSGINEGYNILNRHECLNSAGPQSNRDPVYWRGHRMICGLGLGWRKEGRHSKAPEAETVLFYHSNLQIKSQEVIINRNIPATRISNVQLGQLG
ncbi:hypothetical protein TWF594_000535 [Orbilia oligospora]|nr:hypothetical protein TWF594_000535 [Orbilia oligospora]